MAARKLRPGTEVKSRATGRVGTVVKPQDTAWDRKGYLRVIWSDQRSDSRIGALVDPQAVAPTQK